MDYDNEESTPIFASNWTTVHIIDGCVAFIFGLFALFCMLKCCCCNEQELSSEKKVQPSAAPVGDQHDDSRLVIMPGDRNPTCIAMPVSVSSPHQQRTHDG